MQTHSIYFIAEYRFPDCKNKSTLPFDFCIFNNNNSIKCLIEYNGNIHYKATGGWFTEEALASMQQRDKIKQDYCIKHNYRLIIITDINNIDQILTKEIL